jgi:hypothetical protein
MKKERILLAQDNVLLSEICSDLAHFKPLLENLKTIYESLEIGPFTSEIYKEIFHSGTAEISERFRASIESDIEKMGISKSFIKNNITEKAETLWNTFSDYISELKKFKPETFTRQKRLNLKQISFNDNGFFIASEDEENILEECRIYLENEKEMELFDNLKHFIEAYNKVNENLEELQFRFTYEQGKGVTAIANVFLNSTENGYSVNPHNIKFAANYKENKLRFS